MAPRRKAQLAPEPKIVPPTSGGSGIDITNTTTYFESLANKELSNPKNTKDNMLPEVETETFGMQSEIIGSPVKPTPVVGRKSNVEEIVPTEALRPLEELNAQNLAQYVVNAHYIIDTVNKKKYLQNTIITLPANEDDLPKLFKTCLKTNRISKYIDLQKQVSHNVVAYDPRKRKYVEVGTTEYDEYMKYLDEERARINKANDAKLLKERKKLGFTE